MGERDEEEEEEEEEAEEACFALGLLCFALGRHGH